MLKFPNRKKIYLNFRQDHENLNPNESQLELYELNIEHNLPLFFVNPQFLENRDFSSAIIETLNHYQFYKKNTQKLSNDWNLFHDNKNFFEILKNN